MLKVKTSQLSAGLFAMGAVMLGTATAQAATPGDSPIAQILNTSPLWADAATYHACMVVNVTGANINVAIELISASGTVIKGSSTPVLISAGTIYELAESSGTGFARCRFTLNNSADSIRANLTIFHYLGTGSNYQTYATSEAR
jgi:hypothetical protein